MRQSTQRIPAESETPLLDKLEAEDAVSLARGVLTHKQFRCWYAHAVECMTISAIVERECVVWRVVYEHLQKARYRLEMELERQKRQEDRTDIAAEPHGDPADVANTPLQQALRRVALRSKADYDRDDKSRRKG